MTDLGERPAPGSRRHSIGLFFSEQSSILWLIACGLLLMGAIGAGTFVTVDRFRDNAIQAGKDGLESAVLLLQRHFDQRFGDFTGAQEDVIAELQSHSIASADIFRSEMGTLTVHEAIRAKTGNRNDVAGVNVFDDKGVLINSSQRWPVEDIAITDRAYFGRLKSSRAAAMEIEVVDGRFSASSKAIVFARRVNGPHGEFFGVVTRAVPPTLLQDFFGSVGLGDNASVAMHHRDGSLLARYPQVDGAIGRNFKVGPPEQIAVFNRNTYSARLTSPMDHKERLLASRSLSSLPLVIVATRDVDSVLASWRSQTNTFVIIAAFALLVVVTTLYAIFRLTTRRLSLEKIRLDTAVNNMGQGLLLFDAQQRLIVCNQRYLEMYGLSADVIKPGCHFRDVIRHRKESGSFTGDLERYCEEILSNLQRPHSSLMETADRRLIQIGHKPVEGGGWLATHEDVTERVRAQEKIARLAHHDALTDLPNRILLREHVEARLSQRGSFIVLYIDVDGFKRVNDTLGHQTGDELLVTIASRLQECIGSSDLVARLGGDEFAVVKSCSPDPETVVSFVEVVQRSLRAPVGFLGPAVQVDASIGIALSSRDGSNFEDLLRNADLAMYDAKAGGRHTYKFFAPEMDSKSRARRRLEANLRTALADESLELHYQPLVELATNRITGCEALMRWRHAELGMIPPGEFIPIAEETGIIDQLGEWALRQACTDAAGWPSEMVVAVNVSPVQFKSGTFALKVASVLAETGLSASRLELEITEAVLITDDDQALAVLNQLRHLGVRIALDDFGTGYASMSYLRRFQFDKIKIDRSFVADLDKSDEALSLVEAVLGMAAARRMATTAEGVETESQREILRNLGCEQMQGYLFSPAVPADHLMGLLDLQPQAALTTISP